MTDSVFTQDDNNNAALNTVVGQAIEEHDKRDVFTTDQNGNSAIRVVGGAGSVGEDRVIILSATMPEATEDLVGKFYCYKGQTGLYTHGWIYECREIIDTTYTIAFDPVTGEAHQIGFDYEGHDLMDFFRYLAQTWQDWGYDPINPEDIATGSFVFNENDYCWYITAYDADGNELFSNIGVTPDGDEYSLTAFGFVYLNPFPADYPDGYTENFELVPHQNISYGWVQTDVQPQKDIHYKGWFATQYALEQAFPTGQPGDYAMVGESGGTVWAWDADNQAWVDTYTSGMVQSVNGQTGTVILPIPTKLSELTNDMGFTTVTFRVWED